jgi:dynein heavy chain
LVQNQEEAQAILGELDRSANETESRVKLVEEEEAALQETKASAEQIRSDSEGQLAQAIPDLKKAIKGLRKLSKADLTELKSIRKPSMAVYTLMKCICILLDAPPKKVKTTGEKVNHIEDDYWQPATGKRVLNNFQLVEVLSSLNPENLSPEIMTKLDKAKDEEEFTYENI